MLNKKILIVAAHPDDEILGCGGTILKYKNNNLIQAIFMTDGVSSRGKNKEQVFKRKKACLDLFKNLSLPKPTFLNFPDNELDKIPLLKIIKKIELKVNTYQPEIIITHYSDCLNIDHRITFQAVVTACRPINNISVKKILSFEIPSSTDWALFRGKSFQPNYYIDISKYINNKIKLIKFYKEELRNYPHSRSIPMIKALASVRGSSCGVKFAEGFYLNRFID